MQSVRHAVRQIVRNPRSSALAVGIIGLAMGASVGIGTIVDRAILRPLPYPDPDRLVVPWNTYPQWRESENLRAFWDRVNLSWPEYAALRERRDAFSEVAIYSANDAVLAGEDRAEIVSAGLATHGLLRVLDVPMARGRWFTADEDRQGVNPVAVISDGFWRGPLGGDPNVVGRTVSLDDQATTIVGVLPPAFEFKIVNQPRPPDLWLPLGRVADPNNAGNHSFLGVARLSTGVTTEQALAITTAALRGAEQPGARGARIQRLDDYERGGARSVMLLFAGAVALLLLLACATVAALQLARVVERSREVALRSAVGASAARIGAQLLWENVLLGIAGGAVGVLLAGVIIGAMTRLLPPGTPGVAGAGIDGRALAMTLALAVGTAIAFGIAPIWRAMRSDPARGLRSDRMTQWSPALLVLVGVQSGLAIVLLVGAALLTRSMVALKAVDPGFAVAQRLTFTVQLPDVRYTPDRARATHAELESHLSAIPGVLAVAGTSVIPLSGQGMTNTMKIASSSDSAPPEAQRRVVTDRYFAAMNIRIVQGRPFAVTDDANTELVMVVSRSAASRLWRDRNPIGDRVELARRSYTVVGVAEDVRDRSLEADPVSTVYVAARQWTGGTTRRFIVHTALPPLQLASTVRALVREVDAAVPVRDLRTLDDLAAASSRPQRARAVLVGGYAILATLLALTGLYGVTSYGVNRRSREFAIRRALGARADAIVRLAMRPAVIASLCGVAAGLAAALALSRLMTSFLYRVEPADPLAIGGAVVSLIGVATIAAVIPSLRAARVDPMEPLRRD